MTTIHRGVKALNTILDDAPTWLPDIHGWEITTPSDTDPRHVLGEMPEQLPGVQRVTMRTLADVIGGTYEETRSRPDARNAILTVQFWYAGVLFTLWALVPVRMAVPA